MGVSFLDGVVLVSITNVRHSQTTNAAVHRQDWVATNVVNSDLLAIKIAYARYISTFGQSTLRTMATNEAALAVSTCTQPLEDRLELVAQHQKEQKEIEKFTV
jgi:hypothetical protein